MHYNYIFYICIYCKWVLSLKFKKKLDQLNNISDKENHFNRVCTKVSQKSVILDQFLTHKWDLEKITVA